MSVDMRRFPGISYSLDGRPLTASDWTAQRHMEARRGIRCGRGTCKVCDWLREWEPKLARLRGEVVA